MTNVAVVLSLVGCEVQRSHGTLTKQASGLELGLGLGLQLEFYIYLYLFLYLIF